MFCALLFLASSFQLLPLSPYLTITRGLERHQSQHRSAARSTRQQRSCSTRRMLAWYVTLHLCCQLLAHLRSTCETRTIFSRRGHGSDNNRQLRPRRNNCSSWHGINYTHLRVLLEESFKSGNVGTDELVDLGAVLVEMEGRHSRNAGLLRSICVAVNIKLEAVDGGVLLAELLHPVRWKASKKKNKIANLELGANHSARAAPCCCEVDRSDRVSRNGVVEIFQSVECLHLGSGWGMCVNRRTMLAQWGS